MKQQRNRLARACMITIGLLGMNQALAYKTPPRAQVRVKLSAPIQCAALPTQCGVVSKSSKSRCQEFWLTRDDANSLESCSSVAKSSRTWSDFEVCSKMYQNLQQMAELRFRRQFGETLISEGTCKSPLAYPKCSDIVPVPSGGFCRCPAGSTSYAVGYEPNESGSDCLSTAIMDQCVSRG